MDKLSRLFNGYVFGRFTMPTDADPARLVDRLLSTYFGA